jgi:hypothetical protein
MSISASILILPNIFGRLIVIAALVELVRIRANSQHGVHPYRTFTGRDHCTPDFPCIAKTSRSTGYLKSGCAADAGANDAAVIAIFGTDPLFLGDHDRISSHCVW